MPPELPLRIRPAGAGDAEAVAALHTRSWRASYRGMLSDAYLDGPIVSERTAFWHERLRHPSPGLITLLAEGGDGPPVGFVCALLHHDPVWGTLVDNLHVDPAAKRGGLGRRLMQALAGTLGDAGADGPIHLFMLQANRDAAAFYERIGGDTVERMIKTEHDGSVLPVARIAWPSLAAFVAGLDTGRP